MARNTNIKLRRSATAGAIPTTSNLDLGELALNTYDGKLYMKTTEGSLDNVIQVGSATDSYFKVRKSQTLSFEVKVASKTTDHIYYNQGSGSGYQIDGVESPHFNLIPGNTYRFDQSDSSNSGHPLRFYYEADKTTAYTTGVTTNGTPGSSGAYTQIIPTGDTPMCLYYQCSAHGYMGNKASFQTRNFTGFDTGDLTEGSNLYFTNARADARIAAATTDDLSEGSSNLYFTTARVDARLEASDQTIDGNGSTGGVTISDGLVKINTGTGSVAAVDFYCEVNNAHRVKLKAPAHSAFSGNVDVVLPVSSGTLALTSAIPGDTDGLSEGSSNLYFTNARARSAISVTDAGGDGSLAYNSSTGVITYTGPSAAEVRAHISAGTGISITNGQISIGQAVATNSNVQFNNVQVDGTLTSDDITSTNIAATGNLTVSGNLTVNGTTTTLNTATLDVEDTNITLNKGSGDTSASANGAGITIQDAVNSSTDATILWDATNDEFDFSHPVNITGRVVATGVSQFADVNIPDNNAIRFGNSQDLQIFHNGTNSVIDSNTGALLFDVEGNTQFETNNFYVLVNNNEIGLRAFANGGVELYYDGNKKIQTISTGIQTFGTVNVNGAYTLPTSDGTSGQVLQTDGSGTLSFATVSAGGGGTVSEAFKNIAVSGQTNIIADSATDTLTFAAGSNITLTTTPGTDTLTIAASGGEVTVQDEGSSLSTAATTLNFVGAGVTASGTGATKTITIAGTGSVSEAFKTIAVSGQSDIVADSATDTLTLVAGSGMTITNNASNDTITFASTAGGGSSQSGVFTEFTFTATSNQTTFTGSDDNSATLSYNAAAVQVFLNGVLQENGTDYTATNGTSVVLVNAASANDILQVSAYTQVLGFGDSALSELTGDGSTTAFTIAANPNNENNTQVYIDGVYQEKATYSVSGTTLTFSTAPPNGTSIEVVIGSRNVSVDDVNGLTVAADLTLSGLSAQNSEATSLMINGSNVVGTRELGSNAFTSNLSAYDTDNLTEGSSNLYYTNARVDSRLASGNLATISTSGNVTVGGNLTVSGTTTTLNTATLDVEDKNITLNFGSGDTSNTADGAGITIQDAVNSSTDATFNWGTSNDRFKLSHGLEVLTGNVGIGTSTPASPLEVRTASDTEIAAIRTGSVSAKLGAFANGESRITSAGGSGFITFYTGSSSAERVRIDDYGRVGIGTTSPAELLELNSDGSDADGAVLLLKHSNNNTTDVISTIKFANNAGSVASIQAGTAGSNSTGYITFNTDITNTSAERMRIHTDGKVGIGTASPGVSLDVGSLTDAIRVPNGTTGQRPTAALGQLRYNTTTSQFEGYANGAWGAIGGGGDAFGTIAVSGQSNVVADQENDTLTLVGAGGITITTTAGSDTVTLTGQTSVNPFTTDFFTTSNATTTDFVLSVTPPSENNLIVFLEGVYQNKNSYTLSGSTLTLDSAPASGSEVVVHIVQNGIVGAGHTVDEFTGDGSDTTFTLSVAPMNENNTFVYLDGVYQEKSVYSVSGTTLTFATAPVSGHSIEVITPQVAQVNQPATDSINAIGMFDDTTMMGSTVTSTTLTTTSASTIATHAAATYRTVKYLVQLTQGTDYHSTEINLIHDGTTVYITEYGTLFDNAALGTLSATISSGNILLQLTPGSNSSLTARVVSTAIPV